MTARSWTCARVGTREPRSPIRTKAGITITRTTILELEHYGHVKRLGNWDARPGSSLAKHGGGRTGPDYFRGALELLRATYIGYHGYAHEWLADNPELTGELLNRCGYWYFPHKAWLPLTGRPGGEFAIELVWENRGVAPAYQPFRLGLRLTQHGAPATEAANSPTTDAARGTQFLRLPPAPAAEFDFDAGNRRWLPTPAGPLRERYAASLPADLEAGSYALGFKLFCPATERDVLLALQPAHRGEDGFYHLGEILVER